MINCKRIYIIIALTLAAITNSCDSKHGNLLNPKLLQPSSSSHYETIKEASGDSSDPSAQEAIEDSDPKEQEDETKNDEAPAEETTDNDESDLKNHEENKTGPPIEPLNSEVPNTNPPPLGPPFNRPPPIPTFPPPATDNELMLNDYIVNPYLAPWAKCGDGIRQLLEQCDFGTGIGTINCVPTPAPTPFPTGGIIVLGCNQVNNLGCNLVCKKPYCGNGVTEPNIGEECDDANNESADGCSSTCQYEYCGNGRLDPGEQCDNGQNGIIGPGGACSPCCLYELCGNGVLDTFEECDDGNAENGDGCDNNCTTTKT